jgi:hypothetical protein
MLHTNKQFESIPLFMPSLFIPRAFINITQSAIIKTFKKMKFGRIESVVMLKHTSPTGELYNSVIVNIIWNTDPSSRNVRNSLLNGREINIMYDNPWFWKVVAYKIATIKKSVKFSNNRQQTQDCKRNCGRDTIEINENTDEFGRDITRYVKKPILTRGNDVCIFKKNLKRNDHNHTPINWADVESSDEDAELNNLCDLMPQLYIRPQSPDCPPPERPTTPEFPPPPQEKTNFRNGYFDIDNLNDETNRFVINYSGALPVPKIKRRVVRK